MLIAFLEIVICSILNTFELQEIIGGVESVIISSNDWIIGHSWIWILWLKNWGVEACLQTAFDHCVTWNLEDFIHEIWCCDNSEAKGFEVLWECTIELWVIHAGPKVITWHINVWKIWDKKISSLFELLFTLREDLDQLLLAIDEGGDGVTTDNAVNFLR